jgi:4-hydroxy-3-methylbut-2-en-1-yl diphosphate synthase IspG/GcpE
MQDNAAVVGDRRHAADLAFGRPGRGGQAVFEMLKSLNLRRRGITVVYGSGEAREPDIGFTGGGNGTHQVYISGVTVELVEKKAAELEAARRENAESALEAAK